MNRCPVAGCERIPEPGWARCRAHVEELLFLAFRERAATKAEGYELPRYEATQAPRTAQDGREWDELELRAAYGDR